MRLIFVDYFLSLYIKKAKKQLTYNSLHIKVIKIYKKEFLVTLK